MRYFQILKCSDLGTCCNDYALAYSLDAVRKILILIQTIAPIMLIIMGVIGFTQLVFNPEKKNGVKSIINKFVAAAIIFFIPVFVNAVVSIMPETFSVTACWNQAKTIAESSRNATYQYAELGSSKKKSAIIIGPDSYEPSNPDDSGGSNAAGSAKGIIEGAEKVHTTYEQNGWSYYSNLNQLRWGDISYSTNNPSKKTCCATFVGSALYVGGVFTESEINEYNYNSQLGISDLCQAHGWTKISNYNSLQAGDIVIMTSRDSGGAPGHVQIYAGNGTWYNAGSTDAIQRENPYASDASGRFLYAWRKP